ncbi:rRNA maturation RNase YbeY [Flavobacteriaceae bacterium XHP0103]|uniref:rRNA maturation RNase YbeY n=1 Tax=Marixanthotalea marina TaxID=2844359 RepID=UPI002989BFCC|nr:rRNA maturation RNase YbeY [Marixanthotalea marina]MBU3820627.1 rRNA maturation RNase YbeY [Marixanthotalea marina]
MISFNYETEFSLNNEKALADWISSVIQAEGCKEEEVNYIFCDDEYLYNLNVEFLKHDTLTDIISFDYSLGKNIQGDVFISVERVQENANEFNVSFDEELRRVMVHGVLHYCGYKDKSEAEEKLMREKENLYLERFQ